jgi:hypothetical protein
LILFLATGTIISMRVMARFTSSLSAASAAVAVGSLRGRQPGCPHTGYTQCFSQCLLSCSSY